MTTSSASLSDTSPDSAGESISAHSSGRYATSTTDYSATSNRTTPPATVGQTRGAYKMATDCREGLTTPTNPTKVIRQKCLDCCCGSYTEVDQCGVKDCPLWAWRSGKNPFRQKRELSPEQREMMKTRLQTARKNIVS